MYPSFEIKNGYCIGGLSAEITYTRSIIKNFKGWKNKIRECKPSTIVDTVKYVESISRSYYKKEKSAVISPGIPTASYLSYYTNSLYLPTQFLVKVENIENLKIAINYAHNFGLKCYAILGYDYVMPNCIIAWIKFKKNPYCKLLNHLKIETKYSICCYEPYNKAGAENLIKYYDDNIYLNFVHGYYDINNITKDIELYEKLVQDFNKKKIGDEIDMNDWESGIDDPVEYFDEEVNLIYAKDSYDLYAMLSSLGKYFYRKNKFIYHKVIINPYGVLNPENELTNGYLPIVYWQGYVKLYKNLFEDVAKNKETVFIKPDTLQIDIVLNNTTFLNYNDGTINDLYKYIQTNIPIKEQKFIFMKLQDIELVMTHISKVNFIRSK